MPDEDQTLFRTEAIAHQRARSTGHVRILQPPGASLICALLVAAVGCAICFLVASEYARKTTVVGVIQPGTTIKRIVAGRSAIVGEVFVTDGQSVARDQRVARLIFPMPFNDSEREHTAREFEQQLAGIETRKHELKRWNEHEQVRLQSEVAALRGALEAGERILALQHSRIQQRQEVYEAALPLFESGKLSRLEWGNFQQTLLEATQSAEQIAAEQAERTRRLEQLGISVTQAESRYLSEVVALDQEASRVKQSLHSLAGETDAVILAPVDGVIANIFVEAGEPVAAQQPLATVMQPGSSLEAVLLVPTRAAGFLRTGLDLNLLYDAFPYQQFGTFRGRLTRFSTHALLPGDRNQAVPIQEPYFEAIAEIESPFIQAYGDAIPLRSGMTLKADIILDRRSLLDWLLEPLRVMRGRST